MTIKQAVKILKADETDDSFDWNELGLEGTENYDRAWDKAYNMAIEALELVNNFEMAHIITDGRLNGRTSAYKCGLMDGQKLAGEKIVLEFKTESERDCKTCKHSDNGYCAGTEECHECMWNNKYEQQPCGDCISREDTINKMNELIAEYIPIMPVGWTLPLNIARTIIEMPSVTPKGVTITDFADKCRECGKTKHCKDCKYFEYDSVAKVDGIPLIVAHEICNRWGDGCKTKEDGYCFLFESKAESEV